MLYLHRKIKEIGRGAGYKRSLEFEALDSVISGSSKKGAPFTQMPTMQGIRMSVCHSSAGSACQRLLKGSGYRKSAEVWHIFCFVFFATS